MGIYTRAGDLCVRIYAIACFVMFGIEGVLSIRATFSFRFLLLLRLCSHCNRAKSISNGRQKSARIRAHLTEVGYLCAQIDFNEIAAALWLTAHCSYHYKRLRTKGKGRKRVRVRVRTRLCSSAGGPARVRKLESR